MKCIAHLATVFFAVLVASSLPGFAQTTGLGPVIRYSDITSGPNVGGQNNAGAFVTIYGKNFGATRGTSTVTVGGGQAASYPIWSDTKVTFQLGSSAATGNIVVTTAAGTSNAVPFTVRSGNIYFVATTGSDANNGSFTAPWLTLLHARDTIAAGDIVYGMNGVSQTTDDGQGWSTSMLLRNSGTAAAPMAMLAYPGATVTIGSPTGPPYGIRAVTGIVGHWVFAGLVLRGASSAMVTDGPSVDWRIVANDMSCPNGDGEVGCFATSRSSNIAFFGNNVHDAGTATASAHYQGVYWSTDSNHVDMGWNIVANVHGCRGVQTHSSPLGSGGSSDPTGYNMYDLSIHDNLIHDTQCDGIILATVDPSQGKVEVYNNIIYNAGKGPNNPEQTGAWTCINVPGTTANGSPGGGTVEVYGNTMYNCGSFATPPYANANAAVENGGNNTNLKIRMRDNIAYQLAGEPYLVIYGPTDGIQGTNNIFYGNGPAPSNSYLTQSVNQDPLFVNLSAYDFHLTSNSPAANGGVTTSQTRDFDSVPLPQGTAYPIGALDYVTATASGVVVSVSPTSVSLSASQTQQFSSSVTGSTNTAVTWSISPSVGSISFSGLYTAPSSISSQQTVQVTATSSADTTRSATATVTLSPTVGISVAPASVTLGATQTQQFSATVTGTTNTSVTWSMSPSTGTLSSTGLYTAPSSITTQQSIQITATSAADPTKTATAVVTLSPTVAVAVTPATVTLRASQSQQFTASVTGTTNTSVTWSLSSAIGTLSSSGLYTAPSSITTQQTVQVKATSVADPTKSATAVVTLAPAAVAISISPTSVTLGVGQSQQFTSSVSGTTNTAVNWSLSPATGTLSAAGFYTAPSSITAQQTVQITATSAADPTKHATAVVTLTPVALTISPTTITLGSGQLEQFSVGVTGTTNKSVTWSMTPIDGALSTSGLYTAPTTISSQQTVQVVATSAADPTKSATAVVTLQPATSSKYSVSWTQISSTQVQVNWTAPAGQSSSDWIALGGEGAPLWWYASYHYTGGATSGSWILNLPTTPGYYEFHYFHAGTYTLEAKSTHMPVGTAAFSLTASPTSATAGSPLHVTWSVPAGRPSTDSVGLYPVGAANDQDIWHQYPNGATTGTYTVSAPAAGTYEFRWRIGYLVSARSAPITIQ